MRIIAAVVPQRTAPFEVRELELTEPREDEVLVRVAASGMCQTDLHARDGDFQTPYPAVFGHEGAGVVERIGERVTGLTPGDHVVLSFPWCGACPNCRNGMPAYCFEGRSLKMSGTRPDGSTLMRANDIPVYSAFFQQSSLANYAIAHERFAIKVRKDVPLRVLGAFGCSIQTGAGAVLNVMRPARGDALVVFGTGAVGLSGLMAAKIAGCDPIIAVDVHDHRLALARELGATHIFSHAGQESVLPQLRTLMPSGVKFSLETSALPAVLRQAIEILAPGGSCILVGSARKGTDASFEMPFLQQGRTVRGVVQGESNPRTFIPELIDFYAAGRFPVDRMMRFYDLRDINQAAAESTSGATIKPVLLMPH